jgi:hypothetical protein
MTEDHLNSLIDSYINTAEKEEDRKKNLLEKAVAGLGEYLYLNLTRFKLDYLTEDIRSDFILALYPRLNKIIRQFDPEKASFRTYIRSVVRLSYHTFTRNRYGCEARQKVYETEEATRLLYLEAEKSLPEDRYSMVYEDEISYFMQQALSKTDRMSKKKQEIHARKIFLLACKTGSFLDDTVIARIAELTGYKISYISDKLEHLRGECEKKNEKMKRNLERLTGFYIRKRRCLYEMKYLDKDSSRYISLEKEYRYCIKRWTDIRLRNSRQIHSPSNRFLADILGLCRGTIDTTLASGSNQRYCP